MISVGIKCYLFVRKNKLFPSWCQELIANAKFFYDGVGVDLEQYGLRVAGRETQSLLQVFAAFDRIKEYRAGILFLVQFGYAGNNLNMLVS